MKKETDYKLAFYSVLGLLLSSLLLLSSCSTEPIDLSCGCIKTDWIFINDGRHDEGESYPVECQDEITLKDAQNASPKGSDVYSVKCR